jgi:hypothetical protein
VRLGIRLAMIVFAAAIAAAAVAIVSLSRGDDTRAVVVVDERAGVLLGVRFGDTLQAVRRTRGVPTDDAKGFFLEGSDFTGPPSIPNPRSDPRVAPMPLHYENNAYLVSPTVGVFAMATLESTARTRIGVGVGDDLDLVRERYARVNCGEAVAGEALFGGETPKYPWCQALVGSVGVFFGEDPIESITLLRR